MDVARRTTGLANCTRNRAAIQPGAQPALEGKACAAAGQKSVPDPLCLQYYRERLLCELVPGSAACQSHENDPQCAPSTAYGAYYEGAVHESTPAAVAMKAGSSYAETCTNSAELMSTRYCAGSTKQHRNRRNCR